MSICVAMSKVWLAHLTLSNKKAMPGYENQVLPIFCRTPVRQLPHVSNVPILSYWKLTYAVTLFVLRGFSSGRGF